MGLTVNTNMASMNALNNLNSAGRSLGGSFERISSGLRINRAADDAAGLGVAENLDAVERSTRQAIRNTNDGISMVQTAEGATAEVSNIVKRMRELAVQSASETLASTERQYIQDEYQELAAEVDRISSVTEFNGVALTDGSDTQLNIQVGAQSSSANRITITMGDLRSTVLGIDTGSIDLSSATGAQTAIDTFDTALDAVNGYRSDYGSSQNRMDSALTNLETYAESLAAAESQIRDADFAFETAEMAKYQIMQQAGTSILAQANLINQGAVNLIG